MHVCASTYLNIELCRTDERSKCRVMLASTMPSKEEENKVNRDKNQRS